MDGHGSHVTLKTLKQTRQLRLDMITLQSHTSHILQPFNVESFQLFKTSFKKEENNCLVINNYSSELNKVTLDG